MRVRRWLLAVGAAALVAGPAGVSAADSLPALTIAPNPALINSRVVISNTPGGECGAGEVVGQVSALATITTPQGQVFRQFTLPGQDGLWTIEIDQTSEIGRYEVSVYCYPSVPPHAAVVASSAVTHRVDFAYEDASFEVIESVATEATLDDPTSSVAPAAPPVITVTAPAFTG